MAAHRRFLQQEPARRLITDDPAAHFLRRRVTFGRGKRAAGGLLLARAAAGVAVALAGCATLGGGIEAAKSSWYDARYDEVVAQWGAATRHAVLSDGRSVYTWESARQGGLLSPGSVGIYGGSGMGIGVAIGLPGMGGGQPQRCERTLTFSGDRVVQQSWLGPPVFCSTFRRE